MPFQLKMMLLIVILKVKNQMELMEFMEAKLQKS